MLSADSDTSLADTKEDEERLKVLQLTSLEKRRLRSSGVTVSHIVPGTAAVRRRRQSMKPAVEVKSMNHRPAAD